MIVYYSSTGKYFCERPEQLSGCLFENLKTEQSYVKCPSFQEYIKNTFVIRSNFDYRFGWDKDDKNFKSDMYDQHFFNSYVRPRNSNTGLVTYIDPPIIFFSEKSLEMSLIPAFFHNTFNRHVVIPGTFNVGKHFRKLESAIHFFHPDIIEIKEKDPLYYVKFHTEEKITFKSFLFTEKLRTFQAYFSPKKEYTQKIMPLKWYYERNMSKAILKEIKNNLME